MKEKLVHRIINIIKYDRKLEIDFGNINIKIPKTILNGKTLKTLKSIYPYYQRGDTSKNIKFEINYWNFDGKNPILENYCLFENQITEILKSISILDLQFIIIKYERKTDSRNKKSFH